MGQIEQLKVLAELSYMANIFITYSIKNNNLIINSVLKLGHWPFLAQLT